MSNPLERKVLEKLKEGGFVPEWIEIREQLDKTTVSLRKLVRKEIDDVLHLNIDLREYGELLLTGKGIPEVVDEVQSLTRRFNLKCPPPLQRTSHSRQWLSVLVETEIALKLEEIEKQKR